MRTFAIDYDDNITVFASAEEAGQQTGRRRFIPPSSWRCWPNTGLPAGLSRSGTASRVRSPSRSSQTAKRALHQSGKRFKALQPSGVASEAKGGNARPRKPRQHTGRKNTKAAQVVALLKQPSGASLKSLMKATAWQAHSVRGF